MRIHLFVFWTFSSSKNLIQCMFTISFCPFMQKSLGTGLGIADYMLEPVQRIPRYKLLLAGLLPLHCTQLHKNSLNIY